MSSGSQCEMEGRDGERKVYLWAAEGINSMVQGREGAKLLTVDTSFYGLEPVTFGIRSGPCAVG